jgi:hypothetical protein
MLFLCRIHRKMAPGEVHDFKWKEGKNQHFRPKVLNFVHWLPRYASATVCRCNALLQLLYILQYQPRKLWIIPRTSGIIMWSPLTRMTVTCFMTWRDVMSISSGVCRKSERVTVHVSRRIKFSGCASHPNAQLCLSETWCLSLTHSKMRLSRNAKEPLNTKNWYLFWNRFLVSLWLMMRLKDIVNFYASPNYLTDRLLYSLKKL